MSWKTSSGLRAWLAQRLTAVYILVFLAVFAAQWVGEPISFEAWRAWVSHPAANITLLLFFVALLMHAWVGARDVIIDYMHSTPVRYILLIVFGLGLIILGLWTLRILLLVSTG